MVKGMNQGLFFDELRIGDRWTSRGRTVTESDVSQFAGLTGDFDPLHVDHDFASDTPFGQPIAHGLLGLSMLAGLSSTFPAMQTVAFVGIRDWEFLKPIFFGDTVHAEVEIVDLQQTNRRRGRVTWNRQLVNQNGEVVQQGIFETLVAASQVAKRAA